jgi:hypothetical protein
LRILRILYKVWASYSPPMGMIIPPSTCNNSMQLFRDSTDSRLGENKSRVTVILVSHDETRDPVMNFGGQFVGCSLCRTNATRRSNSQIRCTNTMI